MTLNLCFCYVWDPAGPDIDPIPFPHCHILGIFKIPTGNCFWIRPWIPTLFLSVCYQPSYSIVQTKYFFSIHIQGIALSQLSWSNTHAKERFYKKYFTQKTFSLPIWARSSNPFMLLRCLHYLIIIFYQWKKKKKMLIWTIVYQPKIILWKKSKAFWSRIPNERMQVLS